MAFNSLHFLCWFLPFTLAIYYLLPARLRSGALCLFSLVFYAYGVWQEPFSLLLLLAGTGLAYLCGRGIGAGRHKRRWLVAGILLQGGALFFFKYAAFTVENLNWLFARLPGSPALPVPKITLPPGISFFSFQAIAYLVDIYRGTPAEKNPLRFGAYMLMFPRLISGPIVRFSTVADKLSAPTLSLPQLEKGIAYFIGGLGAKVILADRMGGLWSAVEGIGFESLSVPLAWLGLIAFSLQLYFDFYGYSLMAIGLGKMLGFSLPENFRHPYMARSMSEFWRRWHITLGRWFRDYIYIPLGGSRRGTARTLLNLLVVWLLTGLWHGAAWHYVLWGLFLYLLIAAEKLGFGRVLERSPALGHLYMIPAILFSWLIFAVPDVQSLWIYAGRLFGLGGVSVFPKDYVRYLRQYAPFLLAGLVACTPLPETAARRLGRRPILLGAALLATLGYSVYCIWQGMNDPFLYFRF